MQKLIAAILFLLIGLTSSSQALEIPRAGFGSQKVIVLFDVSANSVGCKKTLQDEFKALDELLSPRSLKAGGINEVTFILFSKDVVNTYSVKAGDKLFKNETFRKLSERAKRAFVYLYKKLSSNDKKQLADVYGALILGLNLAGDKNATIIVISPGIQNLNRNQLQPIKLPENVKRVIFLSHPFECTKYSETYKYEAFQSYVANYWKRLLRPNSKVEILYSF
jgi:hypothetical protein